MPAPTPPLSCSFVDDDGQSANLLGRRLRVDGHEEEVTTDGAAAIARLTRSPVPDALITDFHLPHADGLAVGRYARSHRACIPIFLVSGYPPPPASAGEPVDGSVVVMAKPLDYPDLLHRLAPALQPVRGV